MGMNGSPGANESNSFLGFGEAPPFGRVVSLSQVGFQALIDIIPFRHTRIDHEKTDCLIDR